MGSKKHWKMKTVIKVLDCWRSTYKIYHRLQLECGHHACLQWNKKTHYIPYKTKSRCYQCAKYKGI